MCPNQEMLDRASRQAADRRSPTRSEVTRASRITTMRCCAHFLDRFGFDYEFLSATDCYASGRFDDVIRKVLRNWDGVMGVMLPTLREERRKTYSPILPISPSSGRVLQVPVEVVDAEAGMIAFNDEDGSRVEQSALGGQAKLQWKVDWAARWVALGVDYEMAGKDLIDSVIQSGEDRPHPRRPPARGLQLRDVPRRKGREDLQVEGQRPQPRGMAALRQRAEPRLLHLPRAEEGEEPAHRRHPARGRRILAVPRQLSRTSRSSRSSAIRCTTSTAARCPTERAAADLRPAAQPRQPAGRRRQGNGLAVRPALCARTPRPKATPSSTS